jgi:putative peptidoglycan lipid II flippase
MFNVATIAAAVLLTPAMAAAGARPITAIAAGALLGGIGQILVQWRALRGEGFRYRLFVDWRDPGLRRILLLMGPGTIGLAATQVNVFVNTLLATAEGTGAASWLSYAFRLMYLPIGLFGVSIATVVLPMAARHAAVDDPAAIRRTVSRGLGLMLALNVPATVGLIVLGLPIVRVLFEHGRFQPSDSEAVASALRFYSLGLVGYSAARIASPVFYAVRRNRVPIVISVASIGVNVIASLLLVRPLGFSGLALGTSIAALVHGCGLLVLLRKTLGGLEATRLLSTFVKTLAASGAMAGAAVWVQAATKASIQNQASLAEAASLAASIAAGLVALALAGKVVRLAEFDDMTARLRAQVRMLLSR